MEKVAYIIDSCRAIEISPDELKKGRDDLTARIMWDIMLCDVSACRDKDAYVKLLEATTTEIIQKITEVVIQHAEKIIRSPR